MTEENRELVNDSWLEGDVGCCLEARRDVEKLRDQWPKVEYFDEDGVVRTHTFDWHITLMNGKRHAIAVRPHDRLASLLKVLDRVKAQRAHREYADGITIITDRDFTPDDATNAKLILRSRRLRDDQEMRAAFTELRLVNGTVLFGDLVRKGPVEAHRRNAMWGMVDLGVLIPQVRERITDRTKMSVNHDVLTGAFA